MTAHPGPNQQQTNQQSLPQQPPADGLTLSRRQSTWLIGILIAVLTGGTAGGFTLGGASKEEVQALKTEQQLMKLELNAIKTQLQTLNGTMNRVEGRLDRAIDGGP